MFNLSPAEQLFMLLFVLVLLPLVPAVITYRISPKEPISSEGKYGGITFSAGGAFAAYIIVLVFLLIPFSKVQELLIKKSEHQDAPSVVKNWRIRAPIFPVDFDGKRISLSAGTINEMSITMRPSQHTPSDKETIISMPGPPEQWPSEIYVNYPPDYVGLLELSDGNYTLDEKNGIARYEHVVIVRKQTRQGESGVHDSNYSATGSLNDLSDTTPPIPPR